MNNQLIKILLLALSLAAPALAGAQQAGFTLGLNGDTGIEEFMLPVGKSQIIESDTSLAQVVVGNPDIADVELLNETQFLVLGRTPGTTNLAFRGTDDQIIAVLDVVVGFDLAAIRRKLDEVLPNEETLEVRSSNGRVMLTGRVSSATALDSALAVTRSFAAAAQVENLVQVGGGQQVLLEVRIAEVKRNRIQDLGVSAEFTGTAGNETNFDLFTGVPLQNAFGGGLTVNNTSLGDSLMMNLRALEQEGSAQVLAEPNMVALSGQEASFLVGGEFPVPIAQTGVQAGGITIDYREFGVGLEFTPTVLSQQRINLRMTTEVSDIDTASGTSVLGTTVPGLRTRRAATTIELGDGRSFAIAGLLQNDIGTVIREFPGLGRLPLLGALFRSNEFEREETELVIVVTPRLVQSVDGDDLQLPTDDYRVPNRWDRYGQGQPEGPEPADEGVDGASAGRSETGGDVAGEAGLEGAQGHQF